MTLEETLQLLVKYRVAKFKGAVDPPKGDTSYREVLEVELSPLAFVSVATEGSPMPDARPFVDPAGGKMCRCGHALTDHGGHGLCLLGCAGDACELLVTDGNGKTTAAL